MVTHKAHGTDIGIFLLMISPPAKDYYLSFFIYILSSGTNLSNYIIFWKKNISFTSLLYYISDYDENGSRVTKKMLPLLLIVITILKVISLR